MKLFRRHASIPAWKVSLLQTVIVIVYILTGATVVTSPYMDLLDDSIFDNYPQIGILAFLTTFVFSALFCATAVLGYPALLCFEKQYKRATQIVVWNIVWLAVFLLGIALVVVLYSGVQA